MNSNRSSKLATALLATVLVLVLAVTAGAAVTSEVSGVPDGAQADSEQSATYTFSKLYEDGSKEWTLAGRTNLTGVQWTVKKQKLGGDVESESFTGQSFSTTVSSNNDIEKVVVTVQGTTPRVSNFTYEPRERFLFAQFNKSVGDANKVVTTTFLNHFTAESKQARQAIDSARRAIDEAGGHEQANQTLQNAISAYNSGNFDNAIDLADQAEQRARQAEQSRQRTQLALYAGVGVLALVVVFGGVYYWRSQQDTYDKLR